MPEASRRELDADIERNGYMPIEQVRALIASNVVKGAAEACGLDTELMALIDARIDYKVFVAGDNAFTREELYAHYAFHELGLQPEAIFAQQELGVFPPRQTAFEADAALEYVARDVGDETVAFATIEDLVGQAARANYQARRPPLRVVRTKIYLGKECWKDFLLCERLFRSMARLSAARGGAMPPFLAGLSVLAPPRLLGVGAFEAAQASCAEEAARREAELRRREDELHRREAEGRLAAAEAQKRMDADLQRIEHLFAAVAGLSASRGAAAQKPAGPEEDSVTI